MIKTLISHPLPLGSLLRKYFRSGWAFLVPYLAAYLLYWWLRWPVNPLPTDARSRASGFQPPPLLHLYWALHAINVILAVIALVGWLRERRRLEQGIGIPHRDPGYGGHGTEQDSLTPYPLPLTRSAPRGGSPSPSLSLSLKIAPWLLLGLLFWIPGVYLEFPADPWQHYARANEWSWYEHVDQHSTRGKSSYFLAYSLIGRVTSPSSQIRWFDLYYAGCCLLLCWQYYRLARTVGLGERAALLFVLIQALLFGNNLFGFYRYYGMSSTAFALLGAVALVRITLKTLSVHVKQGAPALSFKRKALSSALCAALLLPLIAFNHIQGIGIAGLGLLAVAVWRLIEWRRSMIFWLAAATPVLSVAAVLWWPRIPAVDADYRSGGWLSSWYGFNLFAPSSPAFDRTLAIFGFFGVANFIAGLLLLRRNHVVAWLTVTPVIALCLPFVAIPFANALARVSVPEILTFHRMLLAVPAGLALVAVSGGLTEATELEEREKARGGLAAVLPTLSSVARCATDARFPMLLLLLAALLLVPANGPYYNRFYNVISIPPEDLSMRDVLAAADAIAPGNVSADAVSRDAPSPPALSSTGLLTTPGIGYALQATGRAQVPGARKWMTWPTVTSPSLSTTIVRENLRHVDPSQIHPLPFWPIDSLYTPYSQTGLLSGHWLPDDVALEHSAQAELFQPPAPGVHDRRPPQLWLEWISGPRRTHFFGAGVRAPLQAPVEDRGELNSQGGFETPAAGDQIVLRPVLRTPDGNGWRVSIDVCGPDSFHRFYENRCEPSLFGGDSWIYSDFELRLTQPGQYTIVVSGDLVWPAQTCRVRYTLRVAGKNGPPESRPAR